VPAPRSRGSAVGTLPSDYPGHAQRCPAGPLHVLGLDAAMGALAAQHFPGPRRAALASFLARGVATRRWLQCRGAMDIFSATGRRLPVDAATGATGPSPLELVQRRFHRGRAAAGGWMWPQRPAAEELGSAWPGRRRSRPPFRPIRPIVSPRGFLPCWHQH